MFLIFDNYFVNLAHVDFIGQSIENPISEVGGDHGVELWIYLEGTGDPIRFPHEFRTTEHAEAYQVAVLRHACTKGVATREDLDYIFITTKPQ